MVVALQISSIFVEFQEQVVVMTPNQIAKLNQAQARTASKYPVLLQLLQESLVDCHV